jgi:hypothetical protein
MRGTRLAVCVWIGAVAALLMMPAASALAVSSAELEGLPLRDSLQREESPLSNGGQWGQLAWVNGPLAGGVVSLDGWHPKGSSLAGSAWKTTFTQPSAAAVKASTLPSAEGQYQALWLDIPAPGTSQSGYELRWTYKSATTFQVALSRISGGSRTELHSVVEPLAAGSIMALADEGARISAWAGTEGKLSMLTATPDSTFAGGYAGVEAKGNTTRLTSFSVGTTVKTARVEEIAGLTPRDPLNRTEAPLSNGGKWSPLHWATDPVAAGVDTSAGWRANEAFPAVAGASYGTAFEQQSGASVVMAATPGNEGRRQALWLDMPSPATTESGYRLSWTLESSGLFEIELSRWSGGVATKLASRRSVIVEGSTLAISDEGSTVSAWIGVEGVFGSVLSSEDSTYSGGYAGIEAVGNAGLLSEFKVGPLVEVSPAEEIADLTLRDSLNRIENPLSNAGRWAALKWSADSPPTGIDTASGWKPNSAYPTTSGAYWTAPLAQPAAASAVMTVSPGAEARYQAIWLDLSNPGTTQSGYELSWIYKASNSYTVKLSKWSAGVQTELASTTSTIAANSTLAIVDEGSAVRAWLGSGGSFSLLLSASDSTLASGYAGIQAAGNNGRLAEFKFGPLFKPTRAREITEMTLRDPLNREENPLSVGGLWSPVQWATGSPPAGIDTTGGWRPGNAGAVAGAWWGSSFSQPDSASVLMSANLPPGQYRSVWLDMSAPGTTESGYELRWTCINPPVYTVELSKWSAGVRTVLGSVEATINNGSTVAISDEGSIVRGWSGTGESLAALLSAEDSAFTGGYAGIQGVGTTAALTEFKAE